MQKPAGSISRAISASFNAYPLFEALNDSIVIGPTGNNLRDIRILLDWLS